MKLMSAALLLALVACGGRTPEAVHPSWEPVFGQYVFEGSLAGRTLVTVSGTVNVGSEGFDLSSNHGSCRERLPRAWVAPVVTFACPGISVAFQLREGSLPEEGTATVTLQQTRESQHCTLNADGTQRCITVEERVDVPFEVRIRVRRAG